MPRPERPVDPSQTPVAAFAAALRRLRAKAGNPPYRQMATTAHFSKATLSAAAAGHRLPTWEVTCAYVRACGEDDDEWRERWLAAGGRAIPDGEEQPADEPAPRRRLARARLAVALVCGVSLLAGTAIALASRGGAEGEAAPRDEAAYASVTAVEPTPRFEGSPEPIRDNADPKKSGCADDPVGVVTVDAVQLNTADENLLGYAQLRRAPTCRALWGRFEPSDRLRYLPGPVGITIVASRPATGTVGTPYTTPFDGQAAFGNILLDVPGCVAITVTIEAAHGGGTATTGCRP